MFLIRRTYTEEGTDLWQYITQGLNDLNVGRDDERVSSLKSDSSIV